MLTEYDWSGLQTGRLAAIHNEMACLTYVDGLFVMTGPSGTHRLDVHMTNLERLNAHWAGFCADTSNHFKTPVVL